MCYDELNCHLDVYNDDVLLSMIYLGVMNTRRPAVTIKLISNLNFKSSLSAMVKSSFKDLVSREFLTNLQFDNNWIQENGK